ncbi:hypothetical protein AUC68_12740 [Methyloceanibacter methanicus]|uniref:NAD-dependent epimerase/dehydratase domain-containing protein n=1 Tax=Methyloceanibacter methanicus TaxID=1774968 RepID=A0A1E3W606_9HYPH|nr:hypothetical protein AUC68_12740 [Methyloceanibacter methanicus]
MCVLDVRDFDGRDPAVKFIAGSVADKDAAKAAVAGADAVIHLASSVVPKTSNDDPACDVSSNLIGTLNLLEASVGAGVTRIVFASSGGTVYGEPTVPIVDESHRTEPISSYGIVKLALEKYIALYGREHDITSVSLRISNLYGEGQRHDTGFGVIASFCHKAVAGETVDIWGDGTVSRDFIHVSDVVDAFVAALDHDGDSLVVNIGSGTSVSINTVLDTIATITGREVPRRYLQGRAFDVRHICLDVGLAARTLGWKPRIDLNEGLRRVLEWSQSTANRPSSRQIDSSTET